MKITSCHLEMQHNTSKILVMESKASWYLRSSCYSIFSFMCMFCRSDRNVNNECIPGYSQKWDSLGPCGSRKSDVFFVFGSSVFYPMWGATFGKTLQLIIVTSLYSIYSQNFILERNVASFNVILFPFWKL
jgi:hypothetical protein